MSQKNILGLRGIAQYFNMSVSELMYLIENHGIPGIRKIKRQGDGQFPGGGRGIWALDSRLAEQYRHTRQLTPRYDPRRAVEALVNKYEGTGCTNIPELIEAGYITDMDWCDELRRQREISNLHIPILMHSDDLEEWINGESKSITTTELYPATTYIFRKVRKRRRE